VCGESQFLHLANHPLLVETKLLVEYSDCQYCLYQAVHDYLDPKQKAIHDENYELLKKTPKLLPLMFMSSEETEKITSLLADIDTYVNEMSIKFITGAEPIDSFDSYVEKIKSMGIDEVLQIRQQVYDRHMSMK